MTAPVIAWFRRDLRTSDNPALTAACESGRPVLTVFIDDPEVPWPPGGASRWWLGRNLAALDAVLARSGCRLHLLRGRAVDLVPTLMERTGAREIHWNRCYEPAAIARDSTIKHALQERGIDVRSHNASLLFEPWTIATRAGGPYRVFTPFWRTCLAAPAPPSPQRAPVTMSCAPVPGDGMALERLGPGSAEPDWSVGLRETWAPGEIRAQSMLNHFLDNHVQDYGKERDIPFVNGTSSLSPYLQVGAIGPRQIWHAALARGARPDVADGAGVFLKELIWREFSYHLLFHAPGLPEHNLDRTFDAMPWRDDADNLDRWRKGQTGYPMVDAGMRQLWQTGWMHNRVRMVVASFLTKHLLIDWRQGALWFLDTLVDADLASNSASWQWVAGCGADAAPFFRIFNPVAQGEKFDRDGSYVRRWVPELSLLPDKVLHKPWSASPDVLEKAGVRLGRDYPEPMVDHAVARARALVAWQSHIRGGAAEE